MKWQEEGEQGGGGGGGGGSARTPLQEEYNEGREEL
jgi:hypothetical protein